jgi:predicted phage terminase large subunit-like protein
LTEDESIKNVVIVAFRGSAKSTIATMSYPIWSIIGKQQKKFVLIASQTQQQAKQHLSNIKREFETNEMLREELGPFKQEDEWSTSSLILPKFNAKIMSVSTEQSIRGVRYGPHRPQLIICDDVEDINSVKTFEGREKTYKWFTGEILPLGDKDTRIITVGNLLHKDSLVMRLKNNIENEKLNATFRAYPIIDENNKTLWPAKFTNSEDVSNFKKEIGDEVSWQREYMLKIISDKGQLIEEPWIHYYDELPQEQKPHNIATGVDLAVSQKTTADCTAMVSANIYGYNKDAKIYILPNPINKRLTFPRIIEQINLLHDTFGSGSIFYVENVASQDYIVQNLRSKYGHINVEGVGVAGLDKRSRLSATTYQIQSGKVLFPKKGAEDLIRQLLGFGSEKHDDLCDAFSLLINSTIKKVNGPWIGFV